MSAEAPARAVFLDRDGTVISEQDYLADPGLVEFVPGAIEALRLFRAAGYKLIIVTNQSGIARGLYTLADYRAVEARVGRVLAENGVELAAVFFCPHHPDVTGPCECRKPGLGMYREAERKLGIDLASSVYIGDRMKDVLPALALHGRGILVRTGYGATEVKHVEAGLETASDVLEAAYMVVGKTRTTS
jgi:D-glycero-D-manno-heptose 1,7-bisphosphate phosphatase